MPSKLKSIVPVLAFASFIGSTFLVSRGRAASNSAGPICCGRDARELYRRLPRFRSASICSRPLRSAARMTSALVGVTPVMDVFAISSVTCSISATTSGSTRTATWSDFVVVPTR